MKHKEDEVLTSLYKSLSSEAIYLYRYNGYGEFILEDMVIRNYIFFNENGIICSTSSLDNTIVDKENNKVKTDRSDRNLVNLWLPKKPAKKVKEDFSMTQNFYIRRAKDSYSSYGKCDLYIYVDGVNLSCKNTGEVVDIARLDDREFHTTYDIIELSGKMIKNSLYQLDKLSILTIGNCKNSKTVLTPLGIECQRVSAILKKNNTFVDSYKLIEILKLADITFKEGVDTDIEPIKSEVDE